MRVDRNAAAIIADGHPIAGAELDFDAGGMTGDRLVHRVVEDLGHEMVEAAFIRASDVHAGAAANRLQPLQNLDVLSGIIVGKFCRGGIEEIGHGENIRKDNVCSSRIMYRDYLI